MQGRKLASPVVASLQGEEQPADAVLRLSHRVPAGSVFQVNISYAWVEYLALHDELLATS